MKKFIYILFLFIFQTISNNTNASHLMGSDITYTCLGNNKYHVIVTVYRDCNGIQISADQVTATCSTGANVSKGFSLTETNVVDITGVGDNCPTSSRCKGANYPYGIEQHTFETDIDLSAFASAGCCWVTLSWQQSARNGAITTGAAGQNFYTEAKLNLCVTPCNNSPTFTSKPAAIICEGQNFVFNNGALDTLDGKDSLSYDFLDPLSAAGTTIPYASPYSKKAPLTYLGFPRDPTQLRFPAGFILDTTSGDILTRPMKAGESTVFVIQVTEWRKINGVMTPIGITRRDIQIIVIKCPNNKVPDVKEPTNTYKFTVCAGDNICINFNTTDADTADTVVLAWNGGIPGAVFRHNNKQVKLASGSVCWTPGLDKVSNIPYSFTVTGKDNGCPQAGQTVRSFQITVREAPEADHKLTKLPCGNVALSYVPKKSYPGFKATWKVSDQFGTPYYTSVKINDTLLMRPGKNTVTLDMSTSSPCYSQIVDTVVIDPYVKVELPPDTYICKGDSMTLTAFGSFGPLPYKFEWLLKQTPNPTTESIKVSPDSLKSYAVKITDAKGCVNYDTMKVDVKPLPDVSIPEKARICEGTSFLVDAGNDLVNWKFQWNNGAGDTLRYLTPRDSGQYVVKVTDENFCVNRDTFNLFVNKVPLDIGADTAICENSFYTGRASGADSYEWSLLPDPTIVGTEDSFKIKITQSLFIMLKATTTYDNITCSNTDTVAITFNPLPPVVLNLIPAQCRGIDYINLTNLGVNNPTQLDGIWTSIPNTGAIRNTNEFVIDSVPAPGQKIYSLIYTVTNEKGCKNSASTPLTINDTAEASIGDLSLCGNAGKIDLKQIQSLQTRKVGQQIFWLSPDQQLLNAISREGGLSGFTDSLDFGKLTQGASYTLILELTDALTRCVNLDTATITSRPVPIVDANTLPAICENDTTLDLDLAALPSPAGGFWFAKNPNKTSVIDSALFDPKKITNGANQTIQLYYTYDIPNNNCPVTDSTTIFLKEKPAIQTTVVPDACETKGSISMMDYVTPKGGSWYGDGNITKGGLINTKATGPSQLNFSYDYYDITSKCRNKSTSSINVQRAPKITVISPPAACEGAIFNVNSSPGGAKQMIWETQGDGTFILNGLPSSTSPDSNTVYTPGENDKASKGFRLCAKTIPNPTEVCPAAQGCFDVVIYPTPTVEILQPDNDCVPLEAQMVAKSPQAKGARFTWDFGDPTSGDLNVDSLRSTGHRYENPGTYTVKVHIVSFPGGCQGDATPITVEAYPNPVAYFTPDRHETTILSTKFEFTNGSTVSTGNIREYHWDFGVTGNGDTSNAVNPMYEYPTDTGTYYVNLLVVTDKKCEAEYQDTLVIRPDITVFIPNAFTPNNYGPNSNDRFFVHADGIKTFSIRIFDRWGEQVYQSNSIEDGWDGLYKGEPAQQDVYVYRVDVVSNSDKDYSFYGTITLLR